MGVVQELTWKSISETEFNFLHSPVIDGIWEGRHFAPGPNLQLCPGASLDAKSGKRTRAHCSAIICLMALMLVSLFLSR
jgi:hypothetical protein